MVSRLFGPALIKEPFESFPPPTDRVTHHHSSSFGSSSASSSASGTNYVGRSFTKLKDSSLPNTSKRVSFGSKTMSHGEGRAHSPDGSTGGSSHNGSHTTKTGRKGDPRMHRQVHKSIIPHFTISWLLENGFDSQSFSLLCNRAVSARLHDPNLTLFEALKAGGFDYPDDNNPNHVDGENITLAQRKNQLSRRLRIARRTDNHTKFPVTSATDNQNKFESLVEKQKQSFQMMQQSMELQKQNPGQACAPAPGMKRARSDSQQCVNGASTMQPQQQPSPDSAARKSLLDDDNEDNAQKQPPAQQMMAKFHPNFQPLLVPPAGLHYAQSAPFPNTNSQQLNGYNTMNHPQGGMFYPNPGFQIPNMAPAPQHGGAPVTDGSQMNHAQPQQQPMANPHQGSAPSSNGSNISGVAMRSLTNTAQSAGLSLEQLALALSSTRNLAQIVLGDEDGTSASEQKKKKQKLALQLYQHEVRPVYSRCMLLAGFDSELSSETSKEYLKFAWKAWQKEGRRLRDLLEENDMLVDEAPDFAATEQGQSKEQQRPAKKPKTNDEQGEQGAAHSHSHANHPDKDCHTEDGRHIHRLEKCGHKAILHQPRDGEAHIDFVVGDKVECYEGIATQEGNSKWPSLYPCDKCETEAGSLSDLDLQQQSSENAPKVLDLKELNLDTSEWNVDFVDDTLHGLVRLGEGNRFSESSSHAQQQHLGDNSNIFSPDVDSENLTI